MNRFVVCIEGWDSDLREIHLIPEIRLCMASCNLGVVCSLKTAL